MTLTKILVPICLYCLNCSWFLSVDSQESCHQMSDFKAKMHQIRFRLGLCPRPRWGAYSAPPDLLAGFKGPTSKGREGRWGREENEGGREGRGREKTGGEGKRREVKGRKGKGGAPRKKNLLHQYSDWYTGRWWVCCYILYSEEGPGWAGAPPSPLLALPICNSSPINGQCTNFILFDAAL